MSSSIFDTGEQTRPGFQVPVLGMVGGFFGAIGLLVLFQQFEIFYPTRTMTIAFLVGGVLLNLVVANVVVAIPRRAATESAPVDEPTYVEPAAAEQPTIVTPTATVLDEPTMVLPTAVPPQETTAPTGWAPTHVVPAAGLPAWTDPDPLAAPAARLDPGLDVVVDRREGDWAHVICSNGWAAWVDGRLLEDVSR